MLTTEQSDGAAAGFRATQNVSHDSKLSQKRSVTFSNWQNITSLTPDVQFEIAKTLVAMLIVAAAIFFFEGFDHFTRSIIAILTIAGVCALHQLIQPAPVQEEQSEATNTLHETLEHMPHGLAHWDAQAQLLWCNSAYRELMGLEEKAAEQGAPYAEIMTEATNPITFDAHKDDEHHRVVVARCADEKIIRIEDISDPDHSFVTVIIDSTEHHAAKKAKKALQEQYRELAKQYHAEKIAAEAASRSKTSFLAHLSHDMRTPLNHIIGFADLVQHEPYGPLGDKRYSNYISDIKQSGEALLDNFASILDLAQLEGGQTIQNDTDVDMYKFVKQSLRRHAARAKRAGLKLDAMNLCESVVKADPALLRRMVDNLLDNAIRFTQEGGSIVLNCWCGNDGVVLEVTDSGIGMPQERVELLSQPFILGEAAFTKDHNALGLGIATSRAIAELSGGSLVIDSNPGIGTTVAITLPAKIEDGTLEKAA
ncbi:PAS domain-containing sensor histidine kinase [uncultured Maritalea sp.]|uniref:sensor histidine kinase n=1 Tax=uncultured Maritalea sp. TaxID=757249 RepID=UPI00261E36F9|nr:PAS domain-containing sensor histidine kinase [uncultured Maritalea sp.]